MNNRAEANGSSGRAEAVGVLLLVGLVLSAAGCRAREAPPLDAARLQKTQAWAAGISATGGRQFVADPASPEWAEFQRMLKERQIPEVPFLIGAAWLEASSGKGVLNLQWIQRADRPSPVRQVAIRVQGGSEARYPLYVKAADIGGGGDTYLWELQLPLDISTVQGVQGKKSVSVYGAKFGNALLLEASRRTLLVGVDVQLLDESGRASNWITLRELPYPQDRGDTARAKEAR